MRRVLFVLKSFQTHDAQNALCVEGVAAELKRLGCETEYISYELRNDLPQEESVYPVFDAKKFPYQKKLTKVLFPPVGSKTLVERLCREILLRTSEKKYDAVVAVINPPETAEALYLAKRSRPELNCILYEIDPNSNRYKYPSGLKERLWTRRTTAWERKIYRTLDHVVHMTTHKAHYARPEFSDFAGKSLYLDIPNFIPHPLQRRKTAGDKVELLYGGAFYPKLREPYYMLELFDRVNAARPLVLRTYTGNSMREELTRQSSRCSFFELHGEIPQTRLMAEMRSADVLISIGNRDSDFLPSKTLTYMSTGKPVIHFYSDDADVSLRYFRHYPAIFPVDQRKPIDADLLRRLEGFLDRAQTGIGVDLERLKTELRENTPDYTAKKMLELL